MTATGDIPGVVWRSLTAGQPLPGRDRRPPGIPRLSDPVDTWLAVDAATPYVRGMRTSDGRTFVQVLTYPCWRETADGAILPAQARFRQDGARWIADEMVHSVEVETAGAANGQIILRHDYEATPHTQVWHYVEVGCEDESGALSAFADLSRTDQPPVLVAENRLRWRDYWPGIDLDILVNEHQVRAIIYVQDAARRDLLSRVPARGRLAFRNRLGRAQLNHEWAERSGAPVDFAAARAVEGAVDLRSAGRAKARMPAARATVEGRPWRATDPGRALAAKSRRFRLVAGQSDIIESVSRSFLAWADGGIVLNDTVSYQEGVNGYSGCADGSGTVYFDDPGSIPYGDENDEYLRIWNFSDDGWNGGCWFGFVWIRFTVAAYLGSITAATLDLTRVMGGGDAPDEVAAYGCLRDAVEGELHYTRYAVGGNWTTPGAAGSGTDHTADPYSDPEVWDGTTDLKITYNAAGLAAWNTRQNSGPNKGDLILADGASGLTRREYQPPDHGGFFYSSENEATASRPKLTLTYGAGSPPSKPTIAETSTSCSPCTEASATGSAYQGDDELRSVQWECRNFSTDALIDSETDESPDDPPSWTATVPLGTPIYFRCRYTDLNGTSDWSDKPAQAHLTTNNVPAQPTVTVDGVGTNAVGLSSTGGDSGCTILHGDWEIRRQSDNGLVASSYDDADHTTAITFTGLPEATALKALHRRANSCGDGPWGEALFSTLAGSGGWPRFEFNYGGMIYAILPDIQYGAAP